MERCRYTEAFLQIYMASQELRAFLSRVDSRYVDHADAIHQGEVTNQAELAAADRTDLEKLGIPKGAAGLIIAAAGGKGRLAEALIEEGPGPSKKSKTVEDPSDSDILSTYIHRFTAAAGPQDDAASAVVTLTELLQTAPRLPYSSEMHTSVYVCNFVGSVWGSLTTHSPTNLKYNLLLNKASQLRNVSSHAIAPKSRPGTMLAAESCTLLLGEDKHIDLMAAYKDLNRKRVDLSGMHYGPLKVMLGYLAAGTTSCHGGNSVFKQINRFEEYQRRQKTSLAMIRRAYEAADRAASAANLAGKPQYLVSYVSLPHVGRKKEYQVRTQPCGYLTSVSTEQELLQTGGGQHANHTRTFNDLSAKWISESGLFELASSSKLLAARAFRKWVFGEVLPSIRKTGSYSVHCAAPAAKQTDTWLDKRLEGKELMKLKNTSLQQLIAGGFGQTGPKLYAIAANHINQAVLGFTETTQFKKLQQLPQRISIPDILDMQGQQKLNLRQGFVSTGMGDLQTKLLTMAEAKKRKANISSQSRKQQRLLLAEQPRELECAARLLIAT
ncbi:TPA: hypothetical protein ACH3X1_002758 [Trebouxia sp. C0004]